MAGWNDARSALGDASDDSAADLPQKKNPSGRGVPTPSLKDVGKSVAGGFLGSIESTLEGVDWAGEKLGIKGSVSRDTAAGLREFREAELTPEVSNILTDIASGVGSMGAFFVPGGLAARLPFIIGRAAKGAQLVGAAAKWAEAAGIATSSALEALAESGSVYRENLNSGKTEEEASDAGTRTFFKNMALLGVTNKLSGFFEAGGKTLKKAVTSGFLFEGVQETGQSVISQSETKGEVDIRQAAYEGLIGGIVGGGTGGVVNLVDKKLLKADEQKRGPGGGVTVDSETLNSGMTQEQMDEQLHKKSVHEMISKYTQGAQKEIDRQTLAEQEAIEQAHQMDLAEQQQQAAIAEAKNQRERDSKFVDSVTTRDGLMDVTARMLPGIMASEDSSMKLVGKTLKDAHRALFMGDWSINGLKEKIYEIEQIEQNIPDTYVSMVASRLKDELTTEYVYAQEREQEMAELREEQKQRDKETGKQTARAELAVAEHKALENEAKEGEFDKRASLTRKRMQEFGARLAGREVSPEVTNPTIPTGSPNLGQPNQTAELYQEHEADLANDQLRENLKQERIAKESSRRDALRKLDLGVGEQAPSAAIPARTERVASPGLIRDLNVPKQTGKVRTDAAKTEPTLGTPAEVQDLTRRNRDLRQQQQKNADLEAPTPRRKKLQSFSVNEEQAQVRSALRPKVSESKSGKKPRFSRVAYKNERQYARDKAIANGEFKPRRERLRTDWSERIKEMDRRSLEADVRAGLKYLDGTVVPEEKRAARREELRKEEAAKPKYSRKSTGERVQAAAIRTPDGRVVTGPGHALIMLDNQWLEGFSKLDDGFVTNTGRFINRKEAAKLHSDIGRDVAISEDFEHLHTQIQAREKTLKGEALVRYKRAQERSARSEAQGVSDWVETLRQDLEKAAAPISRKIRVTVVDTIKSLPKGLREKVQSDNATDLDGLYDPETGRIFIVSENVGSLEQARRAMLHEMGHWSFQDLFGREGIPLLNKALLRYQARVKENIEKYGYDNTRENQLREAEEMLIEEFLLGGGSPSLMSQFVSLIKKLAVRIGLSEDKLTDADIRKLVENMRNNLIRAEKRGNEIADNRHVSKVSDLGTLSARYSLDKKKWAAPQDKEMFGTVNNRLSKELEVFEALFGASKLATELPGKISQETGRREPVRTILARDLGVELFRLKDEGILKDYLNPAVPAEKLAKKLKLEGSALQKFKTELAELRSGPMYLELDEKGKPIMSNNGKAGMSADFLLATCQPTMPCKECYAAASMIRISNVRKAFRNTVHIILDPKGWAARVAKEASRIPKTDLPFIRLLGSGDLTSTEMVEAFNELAKIADRPIQIFSRHHDNLAKLEGTKDAPFIKMGSIDQDLYKHYGHKFLVENMGKRGIANAFLLQDEAEIPIIKKLSDEGALALVLSADVNLHNKLPEILRQSSCPCDAHERSYMASCRQCALSQNGCFMAFAAKGFDSKGNVYDLMNAPAGKEIFPFTQFLQGTPVKKGADPIAQAYSSVAQNIIGKSVKLVNLYIRNFKEGKSKYIPLKDIRFPGDVVKAETVEAAETYRDNLKKIQDEAKKGTFELPGGARVTGMVGVMGAQHYMPFTPVQIKSATGNSGAYSPKNPDIRYSRPTPQQQEILDHIGLGKVDTSKTGGPSLEMGLWDRVWTNWIDSLRPLKLLEKKTRGGEVTVDESGYKSFSLLSNFNNMLRSLLYDGTPKMENNWMVVNPDERGGLFTLVKGLGEDADSFFQWMTALSAEEMRTKALRKNLFGKNQNTGEYLNDAEVIQTLLDVTRERYEANKEKWDTARARLKEINTSVLDFGVASGLISEESRKSWERDDYIPFYRVLTDDWVSGNPEDNLKAMFPKSGAPHIGKIHKLEGSALNMGDPMMNLVNSYSFIMHESLKNMARAKSLKLANEAGMLQKTFPRDGKNIISIREQGKAQYYKVSDPWLYDAMIDMETMTQGKLSEAMKWLSLPKKALTFGVTVAPGFRIANLFRDTLQTSAFQKSFVPIMDSMRGLIHTWRQSDEFKEFMSTGGGFGGSYHTRDMLARDQKSLDALKGELSGSKDPFYKKVWKLWEKIGDASENAGRMGAYLRGVENGMSKVDAAHFAKDLLDFHRHGKGAVAQFLIRTIPFMNARLQGMDRLGRGAFMDKQNRMKFWIMAMLMTIASGALHAYNDGEDWYDELPKNEHLSYWHIPIPGGRLRIPKPFEMGSLFGALPMALMSRQSGKWDDKELWDFTKTMATENLRLLDWPQFIKPLVTQFANKDAYTGAPIVPKGEESLEGPMQFGPRTSKLARLISQVMPEGFDSPRRIDKLTDDLFGTMAFGVREIGDLILENLGAYPADPAATVSEYPIVGRFIHGNNEPNRYTRQQDRFYRMLQEADMAQATLREYKKLQDPEGYKKYLLENRDKLVQAKILTKVQKHISLLNQQMKLVHMDARMSPEEKREKLDDLLEKRNKIFDQAMERFNR